MDLIPVYYVTTHPDIGYAIVTLSKFASCPTSTHYTRLKGVAKYLRRTIDWGLHYWRPGPNTNFPSHPHPSPDELPSTLNPFPPFPSLKTPVCYVDAAHANDLRNRRSTTGFAIFLAGAAILYKSKTQAVTATSSTEAEFFAAVLAAKSCRYIRSILQELGYPLHHPTPIYEDNASTIKIINNSLPTERLGHVQVQSFAIQDWKEDGSITLLHIPGTLNPSDDLTKALGWILHSRHSRRTMGHYKPILSSTSASSTSAGGDRLPSLDLAPIVASSSSGRRSGEGISVRRTDGKT